MVENSGRACANKPQVVSRSPVTTMRDPREARLKLTGDFDASETIERMNGAMAPVGYYERIVLDFSNVPQVKPVELYRFFAELAASPQFNHIEIRIEGLQFNYSIGKS